MPSKGYECRIFVRFELTEFHMTLNGDGSGSSLMVVNQYRASSKFPLDS